ncbi:MAG: LapA family protein [Opitutaceae bacterium]
MKSYLVLTLVLMLLVALFSVQNAGPITVRFLMWHFEWSQALVILLAAFVGALVGLLVGAVATRRPPDERKKPFEG